MNKPIKFKVWNGKEWLTENVFLAPDGTVWYRKPFQRSLEKKDWKIEFDNLESYE